MSTSSLNFAFSLLTTVCLLGAAAPALAQAPGHTNLIAQGYRQLASGSYATAVQTLTQALRADPNSVIARRYLAHALLRAGDSARAAALFEQLTRMGSQDSNDLAGLGDAYMNAGDPARALNAYQQALKLSPDLDAARGGLIHAYLALGHTTQAEAVVNDALVKAKNLETRKYYQNLLEDLQKRNDAHKGPETDDVPAEQSRG